MTGYWTINASSYESGGYSSTAWGALRDSGLVGIGIYIASTDDEVAPRPVVFLKAETTLSGEGTQSNPYTIV